MLYKFYTKSGVFKKVLKESDVISPFTFSAQLNGGQGVTTLSTKLSFESSDIIHGDILKVYKEVPGSGVLHIYTGFVVKIKRYYTLSQSGVDVECVGLASLLKQKLYQSGGSGVFTETSDPRAIIENAINQLNTNHSFFTYSGTIQTFGSSVSIDITNRSCFDVIDSISEITGWDWYISQTGQVYFGNTSVYSSHALTIGHNIENLQLEENTYQLVNRISMEIKTGTSIELDSASISNYGIREKYISQKAIANTSTKDNYKNHYFEENANPKNQLSMTVNSLYPIDNIKPGDTIILRNTNFNFGILQIDTISREQEKLQIGIKNIDNYTKVLSES